MTVDENFYDIFFSYNSVDQAVIERLAHKLAAQGLKVFLDLWELVPGKPRQEAIEDALGRSRSYAIALGPAGEGPWQSEEMRVTLEERIRTPSLRVIPLLLPGARYPQATDLPRFLRRFPWVDFRNGLHDERAFYRLVCGVRGVPPRPLSRDPSIEICPYMGLEAFQEEDVEFFFGREALSQRLVEELRENRFLAVVGPSGSGKSSLVLAGLCPGKSAWGFWGAPPLARM